MGGLFNYLEINIEIMITKNEAIENARRHIINWDFVDANSVKEAIFTTRSETLAAGVKDSPTVRDRWVISFARIPSGHPLDESFPFITMIVDAETGEVRHLEGF